MVLEWAIDPAIVDRIVGAYANFSSIEMEEVSKDDVSFSRKGTTAVIEITGLLMPSFNMMAMMFGGGSFYTEIQKAVADAEADESIKDIKFYIDSPGGAVTGLRETASIINSTTKPTKAIVSGAACSAAYWLAAACDSIESTPTGTIGCIGVIRIMQEDSEGTHKVVSSQTPAKAAGPTDKAAGQYQVLVDNFAGQFLDDLAAFRSVDRKKVADKFGSGAVLAASDALSRKMIDKVIDLSASVILNSEVQGEDLAMDPKEMDRIDLEKAFEELQRKIKEMEAEKLDEEDKEGEDVAPVEDPKAPKDGEDAQMDQKDPIEDPKEDPKKKIEDQIKKDEMKATSPVSQDIEINELRSALAAEKASREILELHATSAMARVRKDRIDNLIASGRTGSDDASRAAAAALYDLEAKAVQDYALSNKCSLDDAAKAQKACRLFSDFEARPAGASNSSMTASSVRGEYHTGTANKTLASAEGISKWCDDYITTNKVTFAVAVDKFREKHPAEYAAYRANGAK